jgi:5-methylcytosine-specific restriction endonuclease McrA
MADYGLRRPRHAPIPRRPDRRGPDHATAKRLYNSTAWKRLRAVQLAREPLCRSCKAAGRPVAATHVDHVVPWSNRLELALDLDNLQSLCTSCHAAKSLAETRNRGRI